MPLLPDAAPSLVMLLISDAISETPDAAAAFAMPI
jgi:hypothetical protein